MTLLTPSGHQYMNTIDLNNILCVCFVQNIDLSGIFLKPRNKSFFSSDRNPFFSYGCLMYVSLNSILSNCEFFFSSISARKPEHSLTQRMSAKTKFVAHRMPIFSSFCELCINTDLYFKHRFKNKCIF